MTGPAPHGAYKLTEHCSHRECVWWVVTLFGQQVGVFRDVGSATAYIAAHSKEQK